LWRRNNVGNGATILYKGGCDVLGFVDKLRCGLTAFADLRKFDVSRDI